MKRVAFLCFSCLLLAACLHASEELEGFADEEELVEETVEPLVRLETPQTTDLEFDSSEEKPVDTETESSSFTSASSWDADEFEGKGDF